MKLFLIVFIWSALGFAQTETQTQPVKISSELVPVAATTPAPTPAATPATDKTLHTVLKQIDVEGRRAVAETIGDSSGLNVGTQLVAVVDGHDCFFSIASISGKILQLDGFRCSFITDLKVGQTLEPSLFEEEKQVRKPTPFWVDPSEKEARDDRIRFAIAPYYALGTSLESDDLDYNQTGQPTAYGGGTISTNPAPGVAVELYDTPKNGLGWSWGFSYDFQRSLSGLNATANGNFIGGSFLNPEPALSIFIIYANLVYRLDDFYFPFGVNYSIPNLQGGSNAFGNTTMTGDVGIQIGVGYMINNNLAVEFWIQDLSLDGTTVTGAGSINYDGLSLIDPLVRLRISF